MLSIKEVFRKLFAISITAWIALTLPITAVFLLPIYLFRWIISKVGPWLRPELAQIVSASSCIFAADTIYTRPRINISINLRIETGHSTLSEIVDTFSEKLVNATDSNGALLFPQFRQVVTSWFGFFFWMWEPDFNVENHVVRLESSQLLAYQSSNKPFTEGRSPWELLIAESDGIFEVSIRYHHAVADGYSIAEALSTVSSLPFKDHEPGQTQTHRCKINVRDLLTWITLPIVSIYDFVENELDPVEKSVLDPPETANSEPLESAVGLSEKFPWSTIREIRLKLGVSCTSVLIAGITGGVRKYLIQNSLRVPKFLKTSVPILKLPRDSMKLTNEFSQIVLKLPVGEEDRRKRLHIIEASFLKAKSSTLPITTYYVVKGIGLLFGCVLRRVLDQPWPLYVISPIVGPRQQRLFGRSPIQDINFIMNCHKYGALFNIVSYNDSFQFSISANQKVISDSSIGDLQSAIIQEIEHMRTLDLTYYKSEIGAPIV